MPGQMTATSDFDHHDPAFVASPHAALNAIREEAAVLRCDRYGGFWMLTRYEDVRDAAIDYRTFTSSVVGTTVLPPSQPREYPQIPIELDPPGHTRYRSLVQEVFAKQRVESMRGELEELAESLVAPIAAAGGGDVARSFAIPMSLGTLGKFVGLPERDQQLWFDWVRRMFEGSILDPTDQRSAAREFEIYIDGLIAERKQVPRDDFFSLLLHAEVDGVRLTDEEVRGFGILMLMAGHETTAGGMSMALHHLALHPETRRALFSDLRLVPTAINELLRLYSPIQIFCRNATHDLELHGEHVPEGAVVALGYASANRDPREFDDPDRCILDRKPNRQLAFGHGHHLCLGANVARLEMAIMLETFARLMPEFELDSERVVVWRSRGDVRGLASLSITVKG